MAASTPAMPVARERRPIVLSQMLVARSHKMVSGRDEGNFHLTRLRRSIGLGLRPQRNRLDLQPDTPAGVGYAAIDALNRGRQIKCYRRLPAPLASVAAVAAKESE